MSVEFDRINSIYKDAILKHNRLCKLMVDYAQNKYDLAGFTVTVKNDVVYGICQTVDGEQVEFTLEEVYNDINNAVAEVFGAVLD